MTDKKVYTYDPNPNGGESSGRNWFNMDTISCESVWYDKGGNPETKSKPGGQWIPFHKITADRFVEGFKPSFRHGKTYDSKGKYMGTRWTIQKTVVKDEWYNWQNYALTAQEAAEAITSDIYSKAEGWTKENKGFMIDYYGWHGANSSWHQKYLWEVYNSSSNRLALPVKGISFSLRVPDEDDMFAIDDSMNANNSAKARGDQTAINGIHGLWFYPKVGKYLIFEMTINGNRHAPSPDPDIDGTNWYQAYWFKEAGQNSKGNNTPHPDDTGLTYNISAWSNEPILAECNFCGFVVDNIVDHAATQRAPHTYQFGNLSPIPFHIDRTGDFKAVYGGFKSDGDLRSIYTD